MNDGLMKSELSSEMLIKLSPKEIIDSVGMADMPKIIYYLTKKTGTYPEIIPIEDDLMLRIAETNVANMSYLAIYLHFLTYENGILSLEGHMSYPILATNCQLIINVDGVDYQVETKDYGFDLQIDGEVYEKRPHFKFEIELKNSSCIEFYNFILGCKCRYGRINTYRFCPISDELANQFYYKEDFVFRIEGNQIHCLKCGKDDLQNYEAQFLNAVHTMYPDRIDYVSSLRSYYYANESKCRVWLFMDRPDRADDNAKVLFKYIQKCSDIDSYFIIDEKTIDYEEMKKYGNVVPLFSEKHFQLALIAEFIISSQCNGVVENPFMDNAKFFRDLYHRPRIIFLQHGVIKDDMSITLNRFNTNFWGFITSTYDEYRSILDYPYYYNEDDVWLTGLPRYDELYDNKSNVILIMPSWRKELMEQRYNPQKGLYEWELKTGFKISEYYKKYYSLMTNKLLKLICKVKKYSIKIVVHPLLRKEFECQVPQFQDFFYEVSKPYKDILAEGNILITDYSSVAFDFAYLKKPIIYYQFDEKSFYDRHTYRSGYFDYRKDGFGPVCKKELSLICYLLWYVSTKQSGRNSKKDTLWKYSDGYCQRVVDRLLSK